MAQPSRMMIAKEDILGVFNSSPKRVYSETELAAVLHEHRTFWRLAQKTTVSQFMTFLEQHGQLRPVVMRSEAYHKELWRYAWGAPSSYQIALSINKAGYLSHGSAVALHGLTDAIPKAIYLNVEQSPKPKPRGGLTQEALDRAFTRRQRQSNLSYTFEDWTVTVLSGKNTARLGVDEILGPNSEPLTTTNLERTLIDIVVRPAYAGGIYKVLDAYKAAKPKVSTNRLIATLKKLDYVYPYHQSIGFLMQCAGYDRSRYMLLADLGVTFDFYLLHGAASPIYSQQWRLHVPEGLQA